MAILKCLMNNDVFEDSSIDHDQRYFMYQDDQRYFAKTGKKVLYQCCCRKDNPVLLQLTKRLQFQPISHKFQHEPTCSRTSFKDKYSKLSRQNLEKLLLKNQLKNMDPIIDFYSWAKYINNKAYSKCILKQEYNSIERYIYVNMLSSHEDKEKGIKLFDEKARYKYGECIIDSSRDIEFLNKPNHRSHCYKIPVNANNPKRSQELYVNEADFLKAKNNFISDYPEFEFDHKKNKIMFFYKIEKDQDGGKTHYWSKHYLYFMPISNIGACCEDKFDLFTKNRLEEIIRYK